MTTVLPSWTAGSTRDGLLAFLGAAESLPPERRVAVLDNDGTLWCERPNYAQLDFMVAVLADAVVAEPALSSREEYAAILGGDRQAMGAIGLHRLAHALAELCAGMEPEAFAERARQFVLTRTHPTLGRPYADTAYQPMLELLEELRQRDFLVFIVTGGGTEFVRAVSRELYAVTPDRVVGTLVRYDLMRREAGTVLLRTAELDGGPNEGPEKVANIQRHLGQRPILAVGNSPGDIEMLEYAAASPSPSLAVVIEHDDSEREFAYESEGVTVGSAHPFSQVARTSGWTVVSMRHDWTTVFSTTTA